MEDLRKIINTLDKDGVRVAYNLLRERKLRLTVKASLAFKVGDEVTFDAKTRGVQTGTITKLNQKTAKVNCGGVLWAVSYGALEKVGDTA